MIYKLQNLIKATYLLRMLTCLLCALPPIHQRLIPFYVIKDKQMLLPKSSELELSSVPIVT